MLPIKYAKLDPATVIKIQTEEAMHQLRIRKIKQVSKNMLLVEALAEDETAYDFYSPPSDTNTNLLVNQAIPDTEIALLDLPALPHDDTSQPKLRIAARGLNETWKGSALFRSDDSGANYNLMVDIPRGATLGLTVDVLPNGERNRFDETSYVTVQLIGDVELHSTTELGVLNGANAAVVGEEIIQFQYAELLAPGKYKLSRLLRGRLGTDHAMHLHTSLEQFALLDSGLISQNMPLSLWNLPRLYKAVSVGKTLTETDDFNFTYRAVSMKPYSPVHIRTSLEVSGNIELEWVRRTRGQSEWQDYIDVPLNEDAEHYEIDIISGSTVLRTLTSSIPRATYTLANQITDLGGPASSITFRVCQMSAQVGRGYAAQIYYS